MTPSSSIDLMRFAIAFMVIAIHCGLSAVNENVYNTFQSCVPFFFVITGYFIENKSAAIKEEYTKNYISRSCKLYLYWSIIFLPLTIYGWTIKDTLLWKDLLFAIRGYLIVGQQYCSWPLWYLLALIYAVIMFLFTLQRHWDTKRLIIVAVAISLVGYLLECTTQFKAVRGILYLIGGTRNGIFQGFTFLIVGVLIRRLQLNTITRLRYYLYILLFIAIAIISSYLSVPKSFFLDHIKCGLLMIILLNIHVNTHIDSKIYRQLGIWIYFSHMYVVFTLKQLGISDINELFALASALALILGIILFSTSKRVTNINKLITG